MFYIEHEELTFKVVVFFLDTVSVSDFDIKFVNI